MYTSRSGFPCVLTPTGQGVLNLLCRGLHGTLYVPRNQDWVPSPTLDVSNASVCTKSYPLEASIINAHTCLLFRTQPSHLHLCHLTFQNV